MRGAHMLHLPGTDLAVHPLYLGGNVFGWTSDREHSFAVLDAYVAAGGNFIDTADVYSEWAPGHTGGESETIIGEWMAARGNRDSLVIATKVAKLSTRRGLSRANILAALDDSLRRLQTDRIDLYYAHEDDPAVPMEETLQAFADAAAAGKVRHIAAAQVNADRRAQAAATARAMGVPGYVALQTHYNLMHRDYEGALQQVCVDEGIACMPFFGLARGFLTGKYQPGSAVQSVRAEGVLADYGNDRGWTIVQVLGGIAARHGVPSAAVALEWLRRQPGVLAPLASARTVEQLQEIMQPVALEQEDVDLLSAL